jgi:hypothetical protein
MSTIIKATVPKIEGTPVFEGVYDFGSNLQEAVEKFGEQVVYDNFLDKVVISGQAIIRRAAQAGKDVQAALDAWKPGVRAAGSGGFKEKAMPKALKALLELSDEEREAAIAKLKAEHGLS